MFAKKETQDLPETHHEFDTDRWTADVYQIQFGKIAYVYPQIDQEATFHMSAWGMSKDLRSLLGDYRDEVVKQSAEHLTMQQNAMVAEMLEQMTWTTHLAGGTTPPLESLFIALETELYLPRGLRMPVTCVTNIVPHGQPVTGLDKFVALLDPAEVDIYVHERRGIGLTDLSQKLH